MPAFTADESLSALNDRARASLGKPLQLSTTIQARCLPGFAAVVDRAAKARGMSPSEWLRQAARTALGLEGFDPNVPEAPRDAGALYDSVDGLGRCYALMAGDRIVHLGYHASEPAASDFAPGRGDRVLPVEHVDSEPFDIAAHWRLPPIDRVEADRVVREFPVVPKSLEGM